MGITEVKGGISWINLIHSIVNFLLLGLIIAVLIATLIFFVKKIKKMNAESE